MDKTIYSAEYAIVLELLRDARGKAGLTQVELAKRGIESTILLCRLRDGEAHAVLLTAASILDNRFDEVVGYGEVSCQ